MKEIITVVITAFVACSAVAAEPDKTVDHAGLERRNHVLSPLLTERYEYYEVCGCCEKDLQCEMTEKAIRWKDGNKYDAITRWKVKWDYDYSRDDDACAADSFRVEVEIAFHLPKWVCDGNAPRPLAEKWESYIRNLTAHERGHRDKTVKAAEDFTRAVADLALAADCSELDRKIRELCRERMTRLDEEQEEYDAATGHGFVQGVSFP